MKKLSLIFTSLFILISLLSVYAKDSNDDNEIINVDNPKVKEKILKANKFTGYKGNVTIEVTQHDVNYGYQHGDKNIGVIYKAYVDMTSVDNQKIIFNKSTHTPELKYSIIKGVVKVVYNGKDITKAIKTDENFFDTYKLYQYPSTFVEVLNYEEKTSLFAETNLNQTVRGYYEMLASEIYEGMHLLLEVDNKYRITVLSINDSGTSYTWKNNLPYTIKLSSMEEMLTITFLDEKGWIK